VGAIASVLVVYFAYLRWIRLPLPVLIFLGRGHHAKFLLVLCLGKARSVLSWTSSVPVQVLCLGRRISVGEAPGRTAISRFLLLFAAQILSFVLT
jgi:hypothetical protein